MDLKIGWFEGNENYVSVPEWAKWFVEAGARFPLFDDDAEHLLVISTPCDSPAAALVSLGVVLRDLTREEATNVANHARAIRAWAKRPKKSPEEAELRQLPGVTRKNHRKFEVVSIDSDGTLVLSEKKKRLTNMGCGPEIMKFGPRDNPDNVLLQFVPRGWSIPSNPPNRLALSKRDFSWILPNWQPIERRLRESYSGACLAGRKDGMKNAKELLKRFGFTVKQGQGEVMRYGLDSMLTIDGWNGDATISRLRYINMRGNHLDKLDAQEAALDTVVVDGPSELVKVVQNFRARTVIAIVPRDANPAEVEDLCMSLENRRFTRADEVCRRNLGQPPPGVSLEWRVRS